MSKEIISIIKFILKNRTLFTNDELEIIRAMPRQHKKKIECIHDFLGL